MDETLVSSSPKEPEAPELIEEAVAPPTEKSIPPIKVDEPSAVAESSGEHQPAVKAKLEDSSSSTALDSAIGKQASVEVSDFEAEDQEPAFPRAQTDSGDVPSWIDGISGITDPDILQDFDFEPGQQDATFPAAQNGEITDDDSMFKPRIIPEEMNAKLKTPLELTKANGDQEHVPPQHDGPITIQAAQADTQMFRKVLKGLSGGTEVLGGDYERPPEDPPETNGDSVANTEGGLDALRAAASETPIPDEPIEVPSAENPQPATGEDPPAEAATPPSARELRQVQEPEPEPVHAQPANWPPTLPTKDDDWDDELDVSA